MKRIIVIGAPLAGKSTYAQKSGLPHYCTDPISLSRDRHETATYMPETLSWHDQSDFVVSQWFTKPGDWIIEGVGAVRALRKWVAKYPGVMPCDQIIVINSKYTRLSEGQMAMAKSIFKIWGEISANFVPITKYIER